MTNPSDSDFLNGFFTGIFYLASFLDNGTTIKLLLAGGTEINPFSFYNYFTPYFAPIINLTISFILPVILVWRCKGDAWYLIAPLTFIRSVIVVHNIQQF